MGSSPLASYSAAFILLTTLSTGCKLGTDSPFGSTVTVRNYATYTNEIFECTDGLKVFATVKGITVESPRVEVGEEWQSPSIFDAYLLQYSLRAVCYTADDAYVGEIEGRVPYVHAWPGVFVGPPRINPEGSVCAEAEGTEIYPCIIP